MTKFILTHFCGFIFHMEYVIEVQGVLVSDAEDFAFVLSNEKHQ